MATGEIPGWLDVVDNVDLDVEGVSDRIRLDALITWDWSAGLKRRCNQRMRWGVDDLLVMPCSI